MRGRKPKPTAAKRLAGNPGQRRLNDREPQPVGGLPDCPAHLDGDARACWARLAKELTWATAADALALELLCDAYAEYRNGRENGVVKRTADAWKRAKSMLAEFGLTPSSRSRVHVPGGARDEFEDFLRASTN